MLQTDRYVLSQSLPQTADRVSKQDTCPASVGSTAEVQAVPSPAQPISLLAASDKCCHCPVSWCCTGTTRSCRAGHIYEHQAGLEAQNVSADLLHGLQSAALTKH